MADNLARYANLIFNFILLIEAKKLQIIHCVLRNKHHLKE